MGGSGVLFEALLLVVGREGGVGDEHVVLGCLATCPHLYSRIGVDLR